MRSLGISNLEDKIVQKMMQKVLESVYEPLFLECSHRFRPGKSCHTAIQALHQHLYKNEVQTGIDIDLANFFRHALGKRLEKFNLRLNEEKTKLVAFDKRLVA